MVKPSVIAYLNSLIRGKKLTKQAKIVAANKGKGSKYYFTLSGNIETKEGIESLKKDSFSHQFQLDRKVMKRKMFQEKYKAHFIKIN